MIGYYDKDKLKDTTHNIVITRYGYGKILYQLEKANKILLNILVIKDREHEGRYRPIKNTSSQDVYKAIIMLNELFETPDRANYNLLRDDNENNSTSK